MGPATFARRGYRGSSREVVRNDTDSVFRRTVSTRRLALSMTCSQLSMTMRRALPLSASTTLSVTVRPGVAVTLSTLASSVGTAAGSLVGASSTTHTAVSELVCDGRGDLRGQSCLADSAGAGEGHQTVFEHGCSDLSRLPFPADECRRRPDQISVDRCECFQRGELRLESVVANLRQSDRGAQITRRRGRRGRGGRSRRRAPPSNQREGSALHGRQP